MNTTKDAALDYCRRGWCVIPAPIRSKNPGYDGWQNLRYGPAEVARAFSVPRNICVRLGEPSGWLVDVDIDHREAIGLADNILPHTQSRFGRNSRPNAHRLFYVNAPVKTVQRRLPSGESIGPSIVELRANGMTVFPESTHPFGELITWAEDGPPARIDGAELTASVNRLADAVLHKLGISPKQPQFQTPTATFRNVSETDRLRRCLAYVRKMPPAISKRGGHKSTFAVARACCKFQLDDAEAWQVLNEYNTRCLPPWSQRELQHKLVSARASMGDR